MFKAKEAESIPTTHRVLRRQLSAHQLLHAQNIETKEQAIALRSGALWQCVDRIPNALGGYIYIFRLKDEYDDVTPHPDKDARYQAAEHMQRSIFPAVEPHGRDLLYLDSATANVSDKLHPDIKRQLGYKIQCTAAGVFLNIPDEEALTANWAKLRENKPALPEFNIYSSKGVAGDEEFTEAHITHDALMSTDKEFIHDLEHVFSRMDKILSLEAAYPRYKYLLIKLLITTIYKQILIAESVSHQQPSLSASLVLLKAVTSALIDIYSSFPDDASEQNFNDAFKEESYFTKIWSRPTWREYWLSRFSPEQIKDTRQLLESKKLCDIELDFVRDNRANTAQRRSPA